MSQLRTQDVAQYMKDYGWDEAIEAAAKCAEKYWVESASLIGSRIAKKIADDIRALRTKHERS